MFHSSVCKHCIPELKFQSTLLRLLLWASLRKDKVMSCLLVRYIGTKNA